MRREAIVLLVLLSLLTVGCSRLTFVRSSAARGEYTQVAPTYDVSDKTRKAAPMAAAELLVSATEAYQAGMPDLAAQQARQALKGDPKLAGAYSLLGTIASANGDSAVAGKQYQRAVALAPEAGAYANNYGTWLCANGRAAESLGWFDQALADPNYTTRAAAMANAGTCANRAGQGDRAEASWRQALALEPTELQSLAGMAALQFDRGRYLEARAFAERWLALAPSDADGLRMASRIEQKLGDNVASQRYLSRLQAISPDSTTAPRTQ